MPDTEQRTPGTGMAVGCLCALLGWFVVKFIVLAFTQR
jgi:hypothetical protein